MADQQLPGTMIVNGPQSSWEAALAEYQQALVDLDGDGIPDGVMTPGGQVQPLNNDIRRAISQQALAGREPTVDMARIGTRAQTREENNQAVEEGMGELVMGQPVRAAKAVGKAWDDPSLATMTNAGVQTALSVPTMRGLMTATKIGGAGLSAAVAQDLNPMLTAAEAGPGDRDAARAARAQGAAAREQAALERARADAARANADAARTTAETERAMSEQRVKEERDRLALAADDAAVKRAVTARDTILADRPKKFSETRTGQVFDELGMVAPAIPAAVAGGLAGAGVRAAGAGHKAVTATGAGVGAVAGGLAGNWPLGHELMYARAYNPEKEAYKAGAREMPESDKRRQEWATYAEQLPNQNPARTAALNEMMDIPMTLKRSAFPIAEGALAGWGAVDLPGVISRFIGRRTGSGTGNTGGPTTGSDQGPRGGGGGGGQTSSPQRYPTYPDLPSDIKDAVRSGYVQERALTGEKLAPGKTAQTIKDDISGRYNATVPVTADRVSTTNKAVDAFVQQYGRLPTKAEFAQVFNSRTLAIPLAAGAAAGPVNDMLNYYQGQ